MSTSGTPVGYHTVTPSLVVRGAAEAIDFYVRAFGAEELGWMAAPDGTIMHAEVRIGDSIVMLGEENEGWGMLSPHHTNGCASALHLYVPDADATFARALAAGATVRQPMADAFWGDRYGRVMDPFGHEWAVATRQRTLTDGEIRQAALQWMETAQMGGLG